MAEQESDSGEKEFEASQQKRDKARQDGDIPQSKEANTLALIFGIICAALILKNVIGGTLISDLSAFFYHSDAFADDIFASNGSRTADWLKQTLIRLSPLFVIMMAVVATALVIQRSVSFSLKKINPEMKKINPVENIKKKYGKKGLLDFAKDTAKMLFAGVIATTFLINFMRDYYASSAIQMGQFTDFTFNLVLNLILCFGLFQFVLAAIDLPLQHRLHATRLKMTREEMKKETKQSEGDPHLKQSRREKASKISRGEMLQNVKSATVIMVNPEHYAVALKWDPDSQQAPVCLAKGVDHLAARIREVALANNIPIYRDPPSARSLYKLVEINEEIHAQHFAAVAAAIQFVERVRKHMGEHND